MRNSVLALGVVLAGCAGWASPDMSVLGQSEFRGRVETYGGRDLRRDTSAGLGMVRATVTGETCDEALTLALRNMLEQAMAMGGDRLIHVESKHAYNWSGELMCAHGRTIALRGVAMPPKEKVSK